jgi:threonylcarbamoyladenosine tRNA methylthiotransferase MtaB
MKIFFKSFGCKVNQSEIDTLMRSAGGVWDIVGRPGDAVAAVVNTCAVTAAAEKESLKYLLKLKRDNPSLTVIAAGCIRALRERELLEQGIILSPVSGVSKLLAEFSAAAEDKTTRVSRTTRKKTRAFIKIQDGCDRYCSYCVIPYLRGVPVSRAEDDIINEASGLIAEGYKELVITGINIALFNGLADLLNRLSNLEGEYRLRLSSLHLDTVQTALEAALSSRKLVPHFHISLQSGSGRILSLMGRSYEPEDFIRWAEIIRLNFPFAGIGADVITAFPTETEDEFLETYNLLANSGIDYLHIFPYSPRLGTKAAYMPGRIDENIKKERVGRLRTLGWKLRRSGAERLSGQTVTVLTEEGGRGHSENYYLIRTTESSPNRFVNLTVSSDDIIL